MITINLQDMFYSYWSHVNNTGVSQTSDVPVPPAQEQIPENAPVAAPANAPPANPPVNMKEKYFIMVLLLLVGLAVRHGM